MVTSLAGSTLDALVSNVGWIASPFVVDRPELKQRARRTGQLFHFGSSRTYRFSPPAYPAEYADSLAVRTGEYHVPKPFVAELRDVSLHGPYPYPHVDGQILLEALGNPRNVLLNGFYGLRELSRQGLSTDSADLDCACLLYNSQSSGFYHWLIEDLTRLQGVREYEAATGRRPKLVVPGDTASFHYETLELLGFDRDRLVEWDGVRGTVDRLVVPSLRRVYDGPVAPTDTEWVREQLLDATDARSSTDRSDRIYVSRNDADRRRVTNEDELREKLENRGFETVLLSQLDEAEAIRLFHEASVVVGPHGAGLTGVSFASDATLVELRPNDSYSWAFYVLSEQHRLEYRYVVGDDDRPGTDFTVDPDAVLRAVPA